MRRREWLLSALVFTGSAFCCWPLVVEPDLGWIPPWLALAMTACAMACATLLYAGRWRQFILLSVIGAVVGLISEIRLWPISDGITAFWAPVPILAGNACTGLVTLLTGYLVQQIAPAGVLHQPRAVAASCYSPLIKRC